MLVKNGTLKSGDIVLAGFEHGKVRALIDELAKMSRQLVHPFR